MFKVNKVVLNGAEVRNLLKSAEIAGICYSLAREKAAAAGAGYAVKGRTLPTRYVARVQADSAAAINDNLNNNTLIKSLGVLGNDD